MFMSLKQLDIDKAILTCAKFIWNHVLFRNGHLSYEQMSCCLSHKINTSDKNQNYLFWILFRHFQKDP